MILCVLCIVLIYIATLNTLLKFKQDRVILGIYRHGDRTTTVNSQEESSLLQDFGNILESGGSTIIISPEIQRVKFSKNFWNVAFSASATLTG